MYGFVRGLTTAGLIVTAVGCAEGPAAPGAGAGTAVSALVEDNGISLNGISLNGISLNGISLNGISLNGISLNGISLNGISLNGISLNGISLNGTTLSGTTLDGTRLEGVDLIGAELTGRLEGGGTVLLRIDDAEANPNPGDEDVVLYYVSYERRSGAWSPLCGTDDSRRPVAATALAGRWDYRRGVTGGGAKIDDPSVFTFACMDAALGKCVEIGYKPWLTGLAGHHQACTRMLRADYCGDGTPHTVNGTPINLYDGIGIESDTENWPFEAEWGPDGARCLVHQRIANSTFVPACPNLRSPDCGALAHFATGTLLMDEYDPTRHKKD
jgi:uncharacterized protein YjbI with pentapeptide repeats